jgi:hypothetical protein
MIMRYQKAIAVKVAWGEITDVMIRPGSLAVAMVIHVSELSVAIQFLYALEMGCTLEVLP